MDTIDENARRRFESSWARGEPLSIESCLPDGGHALYGATLEELVIIDLEFRWKIACNSHGDESAEPPQIESYLDRFPALNQPDVMRRLIQEEFDLRHAHGQPPTGSEYADRFPQLDLATLTVADRGSLRPGTPQTIGGFRLFEPIGEGGMGVVYRAEQDHPKRTVAIKLVRPGATTETMLRRLEHEALVLGRLRHPGIAQVYEAGIHEEGSGGAAFIAMEHVQGLPVLEYSRQHDLDVRKRVELIIRITDAVQHAHQMGVIHRDLKPSNILVERDGAIDQPKVLDFGIARVTDTDVRTTTLQTQVGQVIGTLQYMSPEQASGDPDQIDTRTDIYSVGVILFELLAGRPPYTLANRPLHEVLRILREEDPLTLRSLDRTLPDDLDTIVLKTLEKDKDRRYVSMAELGADLRRFLADEPILARPASTLYQLRKFTQRNRAMVTGGTMALLALVVGASAATWQAVRATRALRSTTLVNEFLTQEVLGAIDPIRTQSANGAGEQLSMKSVLDLASERLEGRFDGEPGIEAPIRLAIGSAYLDLGDPNPAEEHLLRARALLEEELGEEHPETLRATYATAWMHHASGRFQQVEPLLRRVIEVRRRVLGKHHADTIDAEQGLATFYHAQARFTEAEALLEKTLSVQREVFGDAAMATLGTMHGLADVYKSQGRFSEAAKLYETVLEAKIREYGEHDASTLPTMNNLSNLYEEMGELDRALELAEEAVAGARRVFGQHHSTTMLYITNLARRYTALGDFDPAKPLLDESLATRREILGEDHPWTLSSLENLGEWYLKQGLLQEAEPLLLRAVEGAERTIPDYWYRGVFLGKYGSCLAGLEGRDAEAEEALSSAYDILANRLGAEDRRTLGVIEQLIEFHDQRGDPKHADGWRAKLPEVER